jgi:hypothetical protein
MNLVDLDCYPLARIVRFLPLSDTFRFVSCFTPRETLTTGNVSVPGQHRTSHQFHLVVFNSLIKDIVPSNGLDGSRGCGISAFVFYKIFGIRPRELKSDTLNDLLESLFKIKTLWKVCRTGFPRHITNTSFESFQEFNRTVYSRLEDNGEETASLTIIENAARSAATAIAKSDDYAPPLLDKRAATPLQYMPVSATNSTYPK